MIKQRAFLNFCRIFAKFRILTKNNPLPTFRIGFRSTFVGVMSTHSEVKHDESVSPLANLHSREIAQKRKRALCRESAQSMEQDQNSNEKSEQTLSDIVDNTVLSELPFANEDMTDDNSVHDSAVKKSSKKGKRAKQRAAMKQAKSRKGGQNAEERPKRPNYFIALQISSPQIHENVDKVQKHVTSQNPLFYHALIRLKSLHLTLVVMHMDDKDVTVLKKAFDAMEKVKADLTSKMQLSPVELEFEGLGNFNNQVLFVTVKGEETLATLTSIAETVQEAFEAGGFHLTEEGFKAHLTIMKLSKVSFKVKKEIKKIGPQLYEEYKMLNFGKDSITSVQLLSMKTDPETGYYKCLKQVDFTEK